MLFFFLIKPSADSVRESKPPVHITAGCVPHSTLKNVKVTDVNPTVNRT